MKKVYVVGIGPGAYEQMTVAAVRALEDSDIIVGYTVYVELLRKHFPKKEYRTTAMRQEIERCEMAFSLAEEGKTTAMVCSGDAGIYGMAGLLYELSPGHPQVEIAVVPGVTAALGGAAVLGAPLGHDLAVISLSDLLTPWEVIEKRLLAAAEGDLVISIYNPSSHKRRDYLKKACEILLQKKPENTVCGIVKKIAREGEEAKILSLKELKETQVDMFSTVFVGNRQTKVVNGRMVTPRGYALERTTKMPKVLIFAGTAEGRKLAEYLAAHPVDVHVCVATRYGESLLPKEGRITVSHERMDRAQMEMLLESFDPDYVVDATHPYAVQVTENLRLACQKAGRRYMRLVREKEEMSGCICVGDMKEAISYLNGTKGNILAATGSKELRYYTELEDYKERVYARVLSVADVVEKCQKLGFAGRHLICMQGPFSVELNAAMLKEFGISYLVTKESGSAGGFPEKLEAARRSGATLVVVGRPVEEQGYSMEQICGYLARELSFADERQTVFGGSREKEGAKKRLVSLVGIGPGSKEQFTEKARRICEEAELLIGAERMLRAAAVFPVTGKQYQEYLPDRIADYIKEHQEYRRIAVLLSGDVGFYSGAKKIYQCLKKDPGLEVEMVPGISSVLYFLSRLGKSWEDVRFFSLHGRKETVISRIRDYGKLAFLTGKAEDIQKLCKEMAEYGYGELPVWIGEDLSYPSERILCKRAAELTAYQGSGLAVVYIENGRPEGMPETMQESVREGQVQKKIQAAAGLPDACFIRGSVPMTKEEVRAVSLAKLRIRKDSVIYDIGAGTGSVAVEAALLASEGQVYAVEVQEEGIRLIRENQHCFRTDNLTVVPGMAPEQLEGLPQPDCVFIGGSKGRLKDILRRIISPEREIRVVINAISVETLGAACSTVNELKARRDILVREEEILQVSVAKAKRIGDYHMMTGQNPVFIICFGIKCTSDELGLRNEETGAEK